MTTCLLCDHALTDDRDMRPYLDGFAHVDCGESKLFVYGTLRVGGHLQGWLPERLDREPADLTGYALCYASHRGFPYLVKTGMADDVVHGEVVTVLADDDEAVDALVRTTAMELNAGYSAEAVTVTLKSGTTALADAFVWPPHLYDHLGPRIESGDWLATPEGAPWSPPSPPEPSGEDERAVVYLGTGEGGLLTVTGLDGTPLWEGYSYTQMGRFLKDRNLHGAKKPEDF